MNGKQFVSILALFILVLTAFASDGYGYNVVGDHNLQSTSESRKSKRGNGSSKNGQYRPVHSLKSLIKRM
ncbi:hypothetical protein D478_25718 [Brevibacillus agri BAB-2500]|nr:hypothetical protein D478_25718 [Brevibacillus agri BAB-2500]